MRVIPYNTWLRTQEPRPLSHANYRVGPGGLLETVRCIFDEMQDSGLEANLDSYCILITAAAREGRTDIVRTILQRVWHIDIDTIMNGVEAPESKYFDEQSPLRPAPSLLWAIAHAFGINNEIVVAFRVVEVLARQYDIDMNREVWNQLFEWTFVLSSRPRGTNLDDSNATGRVPLASLEAAWKTMTSDPYYIQPTMRMYNRLIKRYWSRRMTPEMFEKIGEAMEIYYRNRRVTQSKYAQFAQTVTAHDTEASWEQLRREWEVSALAHQRDYLFIKRWVRYFLTSFGEWHQHDWEHKLWLRLPQQLWQWRRWAPDTVEYETPSAIIEFQWRTAEEAAHGRRTWEQRMAEGSTRHMLLSAVPLFIGDKWVKGGAIGQRSNPPIGRHARNRRGSLDGGGAPT